LVQAIFWGKETAFNPTAMSTPIRIALYVCVAGTLILGLFPNWLAEVTRASVKVLH
jgi:hypothetical protein